MNRATTTMIKRPPTQLQLAARQALKRKRVKKFRRPLAPKAPIHLERVYQRELNQYVQLLADAVNSIILPHLPTLVSAFGVDRPGHLRSDAATDDLERLIEQAKGYVEGRVSSTEIRRLVQARAFDVSSWNRSTIVNNIERVIGVSPFIPDSSLANEIALFTAQNVNLVQSLKDDTFKNVGQKVYEGFQSGARAETIAQEITKYINPEKGNVSARANLIARDQINKLNGNLTQVRQTELGIKRYRWRTMKDERVRGNPGGLYPKAVPSHWDKEGKIYNWDDPPSDTGNPGDDFQCRCYAEPYLDDLINEVNEMFPDDE